MPRLFDLLKTSPVYARQVQVALHLPRYRRLLIAAVLLTALLGLALFVPWVFTLKSGRVEVTRWDRQKGRITALVGPDEQGWVTLPKISKHIINAIVVSEDDRFYQHHGLDFQEIWQSLRENLAEQRYARGASTITQQVIKMVYLDPEKTLIRKLREVAGALLVELVVSKEDILQWYLNLVDFGEGIYGVRAGAAHYFGTSPELLTVVQAVHLAIVLPSPNRWSKGLRQKNLTSFGHRRFAQILVKMRRGGYITESQWQQAMATGNFGSPIAGALLTR